MSSSLLASKPRGYFGDFGGAYLPEILVATFRELEAAFAEARADPAFWREYEALMGELLLPPDAPDLRRESDPPLRRRADLSSSARISTTPARTRPTTCMGQGMLVRRMGKTRVIAETGAGQHGVATATMAAKFGFDCTIYMGEVDVERQRPNVFWMERLGAKVVPVKDGYAHPQGRHQRGLPRLGRQHGHHPLRAGYRVRTASLSRDGDLLPVHHRQGGARTGLARTGRLPARIYACVGGGSNAHGHRSAASWTIPVSSWWAWRPAAAVLKAGAARGAPGLRRCQRRRGPGLPDLFSAGRRRPDERDPQRRRRAGLRGRVSRSWPTCAKPGRVRFEAATDQEVVAAMALAVRQRGPHSRRSSRPTPSCRPSRKRPTLDPDDVIVINQSGRGDKDIFTVAEAFGDPAWEDFIRRKAKKYTR